MKNIFDSVWGTIVDIFVEDYGQKVLSRNIQFQDLTKHYITEFPEIEIDNIFVGTQYSDIDDILQSYKYHSERSHVDIFVHLLSSILQNQNTDDSVLVTIPMHWTRYALRGFDHMDYLVKRLSKQTGIPYIKPLKTSFSKRQSKLSRIERLENRKGHFIIDSHTILPQKVFLIDDVISTGATAHECAKILKENGAKLVIGVFLASNAE